MAFEMAVLVAILLVCRLACSGCSKPLLAAYLIWSFFPIAVFSVYGCMAWSTLDFSAPLSTDIPLARVLSRQMCAFQFINTLACCCVKEYATPESIIHHIMTFFCSYHCIFPNFAHNYCLFFCGVCELTNLPLTFVDAFKHFPELRAYSTFNQLNRVSFAVSFIALRIIYWPFVCIKFWSQCFEVLQNGTAHNSVVVAMFLVFNILLTLLQIYWGRLIFTGLLKLVGGGGKKGEGAKKKD
jgi:hypothetical protein